jgi:hypothetical protein
MSLFRWHTLPNQLVSCSGNVKRALITGLFYFLSLMVIAWLEMHDCVIENTLQTGKKAFFDVQLSNYLCGQIWFETCELLQSGRKFMITQYSGGSPISICLEIGKFCFLHLLLEPKYVYSNASSHFHWSEGFSQFPASPSRTWHGRPTHWYHLHPIGTTVHDSAAWSPRACNSEKCIRVGPKHNNLHGVGKTTSWSKVRNDSDIYSTITITLPLELFRTFSLNHIPYTQLSQNIDRP